MKILVIGNAGSGKSTLGRQIAKYHELECYSLDKVVWKEHWKKAPRDEQRNKIKKLIARKSWVIDGVDYDILKAADRVIFLDIPRRVCFYRVAKRNIRYLFKSRPELPKHCPEILIVPTLIKIIWKFPARVKPKILLEKARRDSATFVHIEKNKQLRNYMNQLV